MALPYEETMDTLQKMFQGLNRETIATVLLNNHGLIDPSVEQLLKLSEAPIDPLADQKMTIFTLNSQPAQEKPKENVIIPEKDLISQEQDFNLFKQLQEKEDENIAISLQNHYISKANSHAIQEIYDQDAENYLDPRILEGDDSEEEEEDEESGSRRPKNNQNNIDIKKKPLPQEFGPIPKPIKQKKTFKEKFTSFFSRSKKKENVMGKHDARKLQDQDYGEIISFDHEESAKENKITNNKNGKK